MASRLPVARLSFQRDKIIYISASAFWRVLFLFIRYKLNFLRKNVDFHRVFKYNYKKFKE